MIAKTSRAVWDNNNEHVHVLVVLLNKIYINGQINRYYIGIKEEYLVIRVLLRCLTGFSRTGPQGLEWPLILFIALISGRWCIANSSSRPFLLKIYFFSQNNLLILNNYLQC